MARDDYTRRAVNGATAPARSPRPAVGKTQYHGVVSRILFLTLYPAIAAVPMWQRDGWEWGLAYMALYVVMLWQLHRVFVMVALWDNRLVRPERVVLAEALAYLGLGMLVFFIGWYIAYQSLDALFHLPTAPSIPVLQRPPWLEAFGFTRAW